MQEERKAIEGYENLYEITSSGRVISLRRNRAMARCGDEYGFHIVKLYKNGETNDHNVFDLWNKHFPALSEGEFKGTKKAIYK